MARKCCALSDRHEREMLYGPTNEEMITEIFRAYVRSYKDLPLNLFHIQWKFRDEVRPRFGVMRSREFLMKDAYSFDLDGGSRPPLLQQDVRGLSAHLRPHGADRHSDGGRNRARSAAVSAMNSSFSPRRARARFTATRTSSPSRRRRPIDRLRRRGRAAKRSSPNGRAATRRQAKCMTKRPSPPFRKRRASRRGESKSAIFSTSEPNIPSR